MKSLKNIMHGCCVDCLPSWPGAVKGLALLMLCGGAMMASSCDDGEDPEEYEVTGTLAAPARLSLDAVTEKSLSFSWDEVEGAVQYGYTVSDMTGNTVGGGTTSETSATVGSLSLFTSYTIQVTAIPAVGKGGISPVATVQARTAFYECIEERAGNYLSYLINADGDYWTATLIEDRSAQDYKEGTFGVFTLKAFYNRASASLVFTVNSDNTITITNATGHDENGWAMVTTGYPQAARKVLYIDEGSSVFDRDGTSLTYTARFASSQPATDTFDW